MRCMNTFAEALAAAGARLTGGAEERSDKKNYAERLSRHVATVMANALRPRFPSILPDESGGRQESSARTAKGVKKLDVNYSTPELGLGLGLSIKTINFRDPKTGRYTKNYTRVDNELRAEAIDYHERQPFAVLVGVVFIPVDSCDDLKGGDQTSSSFGQAVKVFRYRAGREGPHDDVQLFEKLYVGLYDVEPASFGEVGFFDVAERPPRRGRPKSPPLSTFVEFIERVVSVYDARNAPPFLWADEP